MRPKLLLAALALGTAGAVLPAAPASAYCSAVWEVVLDRCTNECVIVGSVVLTADKAQAEVTGERLVTEWICFA